MRPESLPVFAPDAPPRPWHRQLRAALAARRPDPPLAKFVLFAQGRSGSSLFGTLLESHPQVVFGDEILRGKVSNPTTYVEGTRRLTRNRNSVYGFHVKIYQLTDIQGVDDPRAWLQGCVDRGWRIFNLRRTNFIRHALSNASMAAGSTAHYRQGDGRERPRLRFDPAQLHEYVAHRETLSDWEDDVLQGVDHVRFDYERDLIDPDRWTATGRTAFARLGLEPVPVDTALRRINTGTMADIVENYDEFRAYFEQTKYAGMLD